MSSEQQHHKRARLDETAKANNISQQDQGRRYTVSLAIPGSIIDNAQTKELKTVLAGQIARAAAIFKIDEVVVFDDRSSGDTAIGEISSRNTDGNAFLAHVLQYLETPQYLRKQLFPRHHHLQFAGLLSPLDTPHHLRKDEACRWREGIVVPGIKQRSNHSSRGPARSAEGELQKEEEAEEQGSDLVYVGLNREIKLDRRLKPGVRVTVEINMKGQHRNGGSSRTKGVAVPPSAPREKAGLYWGYKVRNADSLATAMTECPYPGGYDLRIGTSENGDHVTSETTMPAFNHLLVVVGGVAGLERAVEDTEELAIQSSSTKFLFDKYFNVLPGQGSRTIRSEEAVLLTMSVLRPLIESFGKV